jgi:hypothetical protein
MFKARGLAAIVLGLSAAAFLMVTGPASARADELSDLRANQQLLQDRLDQLSQAPGNQPYGGIPLGAPPGAPVMSGSFPRSFLIPGTDTSLRIGGFVQGQVVYYIRGVDTNGVLNGQGGNSQTCPDGNGANCALPSTPLKQKGQLTGPGVVQAAVAGNSRSTYWDESARLSQINFDARTPTPWGEARAYIEMDFAAASASNDSVYSNLTGVSNGWIPRMRKAFATLGGLQVGQDNGAFRDVSSEGEFVAAGDEGYSGRARVPDARYTWTAPGGFTFRVSAAEPVSEGVTPNGAIYEDTTPIPTAGQCGITTVVPTAATTTASVVSSATNVACLGAGAEADPFQNIFPDLITTQRWDQPWGHFQLGEAMREITLNDGKYLNQNIIGFGAYLSGDLRPFYTGQGSWAKDDIGWGIGAGDGIGSLISDCYAVTTNFGVNSTVASSNFTANRLLYDSGVRTGAIPCWGAHVDALHWWTDQLRTNLTFGVTHQDVNYFLVSGTNCISTGGALGSANNNCGADGASVNKELDLAVVNLIWSPVSFVDLGIEYSWGHRVTIYNIRGDSYVMSGMLKVKF